MSLYAETARCSFLGMPGEIVCSLWRSDPKVAGRWKARSAWNHRSIRPHVASPRQGRSETRGVRTGNGQRAGMKATVFRGGSHRPCRGFGLLSLRSSGGFGRSSLHTPATFFSSLRDSRMRNAECAAVLISPSALPFRNHSFLRHLKTTGANQGAATFLSPWPRRGQSPDLSRNLCGPKNLYPVDSAQLVCLLRRQGDRNIAPP